jgi:phage terminase large subunit
MFDSLRRLEQLERTLNRWLPEEPEPATESPDSPQRLSTSSVLAEYRDDPIGFAKLLGYDLSWTLPTVPVERDHRAQIGDGRRGEVVRFDDGGSRVVLRLDDGTEVLERTEDVVRLVDYQERIAKDLAEFDQVAVKSGQKTGKTLLAILLALWWCCTRPRGRVTLTSANFELVKDPLWVEAWNVHRRAVANGVDWLPTPNLDPSTGWRWADGRSIRGLSVDKQESAAGKSGEEQLFILDESSGIARAIAEAFVGNTTGGGKVLQLSNPTQTVGFFYDSFTTGADFWRLHTLNGKETPNYLTGTAMVPGLALKSKIDEWIKRYGENSPFVQIRVYGQFPSHVPDAVIGVGQVAAATALYGKLPEPYGLLELGVDVALFGDDDSAVAAKRGKVVKSPAAIEAEFGAPAIVNGYNHLRVAQVVIGIIVAMRQPGERVKVKIDAGGGYGTAVGVELQRLKDEGKTDGLDDGVEIYLINPSSSPSDPDLYAIVRDELWFGGRTFLENGGALSPDPELEAELVAPKYTFNAKQQRKVEEKREIKKRLGHSPDRADAVLLAIYDASEPIESMPEDHDYVDESRWAGVGGQGFG